MTQLQEQSSKLVAYHHLTGVLTLSREGVVEIREKRNSGTQIVSLNLRDLGGEYAKTEL